MTEPQNILIIRFSSLGDLVLTSPIYREMRRIFPLAKLSLLTSIGFGSVLDNNPHLDRIFKHPRDDTFAQLNKLIDNLRLEEFDLIYDAHRSLRSSWIVWQLSGFGLKRKPRVWKINKRTFSRQLLIRLHINRLRSCLPQRQQWLLPLQVQTTQRLEAHTELFPEENTLQKVRSLLQEHGLKSGHFVTIAPSASQPLKCWPLDNYRRLIEMILATNWHVVLIGGPNEPESELLEEEYGKRVTNLTGRLCPLESAELLRHAHKLVSNDTSLVHMAEAMGTPVVVLFGPTVREFGYPPFLSGSRLLEHDVKLHCRPCSPDGRGLCRNPDTLTCLKSIDPQRVYEALSLPKIP